MNKQLLMMNLVHIGAIDKALNGEFQRGDDWQRLGQDGTLGSSTRQQKHIHLSTLPKSHGSDGARAGRKAPQRTPWMPSLNIPQLLFHPKRSQKVQHKVRRNPLALEYPPGTSVGSDGPLPTSTHVISDIEVGPSPVSVLLIYIVLSISPGDCSLVESSEFRKFYVLNWRNRQVNEYMQKHISHVRDIDPVPQNLHNHLSTAERSWF